MKAKNKSAFTLAEVLMVLVIIGIIASMTIPNLMNNVNEQDTVSKLKKDYAVLSAAVKLAINENGPPNSWGLEVLVPGDENSQHDALIVLNNIAPYLKIEKKCDLTTGCWAPGNAYLFLSGTNPWYGMTNMDEYPYHARALLADGTSIFTDVWQGDCASDRGNTATLKQVCGQIGVDLNGFKKPNRFGKDVFFFYLTPNGLIPFGTGEDTNSPVSDCNPSTKRGLGCAAWVIYKGNMDYQKREVSWSD